LLVHGELDPVAELGLPGVLLLRDLDVHAEGRGSELGDLVELVGEMATESVRDVHVTSDDVDLNEWVLLLSGCGRSEPGRDVSSAGLRTSCARGFRPVVARGTQHATIRWKFSARPTPGGFRSGAAPASPGGAGPDGRGWHPRRRDDHRTEDL